MDNLLIAIGMLLICSVPVQASELLGRISTDPNANLVNETVSVNQTVTSSNSQITASKVTVTDCVGTGQCPVPTRAEKISSSTKKVLGQKIANQPKKHKTGELIRQVGEVKVYALKPGKKHHVLNLAELARDYFGLTIYNLGAEEMKKY